MSLWVAKTSTLSRSAHPGLGPQLALELDQPRTPLRTSSRINRLFALFAGRCSAGDLKALASGPLTMSSFLCNRA